MAADLKVLTWNIQNYGNKKSGFPDVMSAIAKTVAHYSPDLFVLIELNTTRTDTAIDLAKELSKYLYKASNDKHYRISLISPNTGFEFYAVFIKDPTETRPLVPFLDTDGSVVKEIGYGYTDYEDLRFKTIVNETGIHCYTGLPLLYPDLDSFNRHGRKLKRPRWPGTREPALGMFWFTGATGRDRLFPLFICHYAADATLATAQLSVLRYFSILSGLGPQPDAMADHGQPNRKPLDIYVGISGDNKQITTPVYVLTGDFNINYSTDPNSYAAITGVNFPSFNASVTIVNNTHLIVPKEFSPRVQKTTKDLAISNYDNFMMRTDPGNKTPAKYKDAKVDNVPEDIKTGYHKLKECVKSYAELDQRGFTAGYYKGAAKDFQNQLLGNAQINLLGSLVGSRLISDHEPVLSTFTLD